MVSSIIIGQEDPSSVITLDAIITNFQGVFYNYHKQASRFKKGSRLMAIGTLF